MLRTLILACALIGTAFAGDPSTLVLDGSTTVGPIAKAFAEYYMQNNPDVNITVSESGSGNGAKSIVNGTCDIANMSRFMKHEEFKAATDAGRMPTAHVVAMDGIAVVVHPANPVKDLTVDKIRDIYTGAITNWKDIGGPNKKIIVVSRDTNSGTYETFETLVMNKQKMAGSVEYVGSNGAARQRVQSTDAAIGYVGLGFVDNTVKAVTVNGVAATPQTVASGTYAVARPLFMFTNGYPKLGSHLHAFVTLHLTAKGQEMVEGIGFVPVTAY
ncbi:phosphate ABC transporter substrate-binding protein [Candidatus Fermentibacteria bacterium]|nr:phosphate ABC transporter substrate-binding protein [Candidatus Fermentibacteria bacterium]